LITFTLNFIDCVFQPLQERHNLTASVPSLSSQPMTFRHQERSFWSEAMVFTGLSQWRWRH